MRHFRRTDKLISEAKFHSIREYFEWAELWFEIQEKRYRIQMKRRVYIATGIAQLLFIIQVLTDDPHAIEEAKSK